MRTRKDYENMAEISIPEKKYGILKSGTFTSFDILVFPDEDMKKIRLSFNVAKKSIKKIPYPIRSRKRFKHYSCEYNICLWTELLQSEVSSNKKIDVEVE